jgi:hypothetical protein
MEYAYFERAEELEAEGIIPYILNRANGLFMSTRKYPILTLEVPENNMVQRGGETLLSLYCSKGGSFDVVFPELTLKSVDGKVKMFKGGLPLIGQCSPPKIVRNSPTTKVYAVYELYGKEKRRELAQYSFKDNVGVLVETETQAYRVKGKNDPGHSHNTLYPELTTFHNFMVAVFTQQIETILNYLNDTSFDYNQNDGQLFNELRCGRLTYKDTLRVYQKLVEKHNYVMTTQDLDKLLHFYSIY